MKARLPRREMLHKCFAAGLLTAATPRSAAAVVRLWEELEAQRHKPTQSNVLGPFYKKGAPESARLSAPDDPGLPLVVSGRVLDTRGEVLPGARVEVWHADHLGHYDIEGYRCRGRLPIKPDGGYGFETVMPGHYPDRVCQHIHYMISAPGHETLVTQLYFATDPVFEGDPDKNFKRDPLVQSRELVRPVMLAGDPGSFHAAVTFEICLERT